MSFLKNWLSSRKQAKIQRAINSLPVCQRGGLHKWEVTGESKHFWSYDANGEASGMYFLIKDCHKFKDGVFSNSLTKREDLIKWQKMGYNAIHTSWRHYKCALCGKKAQNEFDTPFIITEKEMNDGLKAVKEVVKLVT